MVASESVDLGATRGARTTKRRGRMSVGKLQDLQDLGPTWTFVPEIPVISEALDHAFGRHAPRLLDIGVGNGEATVAWADAHPAADVLAVELHRPGIVSLLRRLEARSQLPGATNVRIIEADATLLLPALAAGAITDVRVLFPDPWPKRRHIARRLIDADFVGAVADALPSGGTLHLATDWEGYADHMRGVLGAEPRLIPHVDVEGEGSIDEDGNPIPPRWRSRRPERPITAYERRGLDAGRSITDLIAVRA